jgi:hypothetical protein
MARWRTASGVAGGHAEPVAGEGLAQRRPGGLQLLGGGVDAAQLLGQREGPFGLGPVDQEAAGLSAHRWGEAHPERHWPPGAIGDAAANLRAGARGRCCRPGYPRVGRRAVGRTQREAALLRWADRGRLNGDPTLGSDRQGQLGKGRCHPSGRWLLDSELVVSTANVLDEGMPGQITLWLRSGLRPRIGPSRAFSRPWSPSTRLFAIPIGAVPGGWHQFPQHRRVHPRLIACDLDGQDLGHADRPLKESASCREIPSPGDEDVDDLPELVDRSVHIAPSAGDLHIGLVGLPAVTDAGAAGRAPSASSGVNRWTHR